MAPYAPVVLKFVHDTRYDGSSTNVFRVWVQYGGTPKVIMGVPALCGEDLKPFLRACDGSWGRQLPPYNARPAAGLKWRGTELSLCTSALQCFHGSCNASCLCCCSSHRSAKYEASFERLHAT